MIRQAFFLVLYYAFLRNLPDGYDHPAFQWCNRLRTWACRRLFESCGPGVDVHRRAAFGLGKRIKVGAHANLGVNVYINGRGGVTIGENVLMGPDVIIYTGTHTLGDSETPVQRQQMRYAPVTIGDDVWLGARVVVLPGVTIGRGCVVGANSVVTRRLPPYAVAFGVPAQVLRKRR